MSPTAYNNNYRIVQSPGFVAIQIEMLGGTRVIPTSGGSHLSSSIRQYMGDARGHWEGNTLVAEVRNMNDRVRFTVSGDFASDDVKVTERWEFVDHDTIKHSATFEDPKVYTRPFTVAKTIRRVKVTKNFELMEYSGVEGDKDTHLMVDIPATLNQGK